MTTRIEVTKRFTQAYKTATKSEKSQTSTSSEVYPGCQPDATSPTRRWVLGT